MATILQAVGATVITIGVGLIYLPAGLIAGGLSAVVFGVAMERINAK